MSDAASAKIVEPSPDQAEVELSDQTNHPINYQISDQSSEQIGNPQADLAVPIHVPSQDEQPESIEEQFLQLYLNSSLSVLLSVHQLVEILTVPIGQIVPLFQMPPWVMGVYNWRGEVLWMVDLNHFLGLSPWYKQAEYASKHTVVVVRSVSDQPTDEKEKRLGLVVHQIADMMFCPSQTIQDGNIQSVLEAANIPPSIQPFLHRYCQKADPASFILDIETLMRAMPA